MELLAVFPPLISFILIGLWGHKLGDKGAQILSSAGVCIAALSSVVLFFEVVIAQAPYTTSLATWISSGDFVVDWALRVDQLSVIMMCVVNIVSACVHIYSIGYMSHDANKARFMSYLSLFTFAMLMLVTADNLLQLFFGWEGVGLASYLLIGFWNYKESANSAAIKAFIVNRVGDFGLALGIMAIFLIFGTIQFTEIFEMAPSYADKTISFLGKDWHALTIACLLLFMGAMGKSAQLGLHTWLPDAMEGPTPVSALIHAATMVTAGVFLVARMSPVFEYAPTALMVVCIVGALTAIVAASIGMTQFDIKRVIAYSTMSQLGYMFFALGVSAYAAAIFHLVTHAFFKALLFLGAGSVIHALSDEQDMRKMGGVWKLIPVTYVLMWIGSLALAGIPPFAGFFSKDVILEAAWADNTGFGYFAFWLGIAAAFLTAFYSWRLIIMTFHGKCRAPKKVISHIHESPPVMLVPLFVLGAGAILSGFVLYGGFVGGAHHGDHGSHAKEYTHQDEHSDHNEYKNHKNDADKNKHDKYGKNAHDNGHHDSEHSSMWNKDSFWQSSLKVLPENDTVEAAHNVPLIIKLLPLFIAITGIALAYALYMFFVHVPKYMTKTFHLIHALFYKKWYFDELYDFVFVKNSFWLGKFLWKRGDVGIIDRFGPDGSAHLSQKIAKLLSKFQSGYVYQYAFVMMIALIGILSWLLFRAGLSVGGA